MQTIVARRIKTLREDRNWTQSDLERESGVAQAHISRLEAGKSPQASAATIAQLAKALSCSVDFLIGNTDNPLPRLNPSEVSEIERILADPDLRLILDAWPHLSPSLKKSAADLLQHAADHAKARK